MPCAGTCPSCAAPSPASPSPATRCGWPFCRPGAATRWNWWARAGGGADPRRFEGQLLEGLSFADSPVFDSWLADQRYRLENCVQSLLYEGSLAALAAGNPADAVELASRALRRDPFHADCTAVLVKALVALGEHRRAREEVTKCGDLYHRELGLPLPAEVRRALSDSAPVADPELPATAATVRSYLDAGGASLSAGAVDRGLDQLRLAVVLAQRAGRRRPAPGGRVARDAGRGADPPGGRPRRRGGRLPAPGAAAEAPDGVSRTAAAAYRELGYLSVQRGVPDRAAGWLDRAMQAAQGFPDEQARILAIQGMLASDTARYGDAVAALAESGRLAGRSGTAGSRRSARHCWAGCTCSAGTWSWRRAALDRALDGVAAEHWTAFEPFVAGVRGETYLAAGRLEEAAALIDRSWVMAELAGDHCYMALAAGAEARLFLAHGDLAAAEHWIDRGLEPKPWYLWYSARLLDAAAEVALAMGSPRAPGFVDRLAALASRSGMREFAGAGAVAPGGARGRGRGAGRAVAGEGDRQPGAGRVPGQPPRRRPLSRPAVSQARRRAGPELIPEALSRRRTRD